ncbi:MAG TPA: DnaB-like helicase N-terminal domain-containing protein, partial [Blastocatellia bacterium]|nr:DnaB-like helicase N-terminal domain-containing protein [Blastocatellia bacterium]
MVNLRGKAMSYNGDPSLERGLPKNIDAEKAVLGAILLKNALIQQASLRLKAGHFFLHSHRLLFVAMVTLASRNVPIDLVTLKAELERRGKFQQAGGAAYIASLIDGVPRTDDISHYVESVLEKAFLRKGVKVGADIIQKCIELEPFDSIREYAERTFAAISSEAVSSTSGVKFYSASEVAAQTPDEPVWIVKPYIACGAITEMAGKVKAAGKTTFLTHLCCAVVNGDRFLGEPTMKTAIVYLTEQPPNTFRVAMRRAGLLDREDFAVLFYHETKGLDWASVMKAARAECKRRDAKLVIVDTVSQFAGFRGEAENNTGDALVAVEPLQEAVAVDGLAVVASRHERKSGG